MKNRRGVEKRRCQQHNTLDDPSGLLLVADHVVDVLFRPEAPVELLDGRLSRFG